MAVLSFSGKIHMRTNFISFIMQKNIITKSLQVPCSPLYNTSKSYLPGKRVLPFTSQKKSKTWLDASMTVEAAVVLPLFVFLGLAVLAPMQWLNTQRKIQTVTEQFCEDLSQYAYETEYRNSFSDTAAGLWLYGNVYPYANSVRIIKSEVSNECEDIQFELEYREKIPFFLEGISDVSMRVAAKRRCWIGLGGKLTGEHTDEAGLEMEREMVYVTPEGQRYHRYRDCRYLSNMCKAISLRELETVRNMDGKIFYSCDFCVREQGTQDTVYITDWGIRYHNDRSCASMSLYYRKVMLEDVAYMGECSVCAGRKNENSGN